MLHSVLKCFLYLIATVVKKAPYTPHFNKPYEVLLGSQ